MTQDKPHTGLTLQGAIAQVLAEAPAHEPVDPTPDAEATEGEAFHRDLAWWQAAQMLKAGLAGAPDKAGDREGVERERLARALYEHDHRGLRDVWAWDADGLEAEHPGVRERYERLAGAALAALSTGNEEPGRQGCGLVEAIEIIRGLVRTTGDEAADLTAWGKYCLRANKLLAEFDRRAALSKDFEKLQPDGQTPLGWKLVPVEMTDEMFRAGVDAHSGYFVREHWNAALAAAPTPPVPPEPDSRAGADREARWGVEEFGRTVWVGRLRPGTTEMSRVVYRVGIEGHGEEFADKVRSDAKLIVDSVNAVLQSPPAASAAAGPVDTKWTATGWGRGGVGWTEMEWFRASDGAREMHPIGFDPNTGQQNGTVIGKAPTPDPYPVPAMEGR